ncbi:7SK snRNA methylphosphate capping enzyme [Gastrophryne carolinensis]
MQVLIEMASSPETLQTPVANDDEKVLMAPPPGNDEEKTLTGNDDAKTLMAPPPPPPDRQVKEGAEPQQQQLPPLRIPRNGFQGKRRNSLNMGFKQAVPFKRRRRVISDCEHALPTNFLLGGNIFDPLNLNSLLDEETNRVLNAETPKSSPLPAPRGRDPVEILIPRDLSDPLSLNAGDDELLLSPLKSVRKRHRHRHNPSAEAPPTAGREAEPAQEDAQPYELNTAINCRDDEVRLPSLDSEGPEGASASSAPPSSSSRHRKRRRTSSKSEGGGRHSSPEKGKTLASVVTAATKPPPPPPGGKGKARFQFGNYCRYYGYRNPDHSEDPRVAVLRPEWVRGKAVLDIGCNVGHLTLCVARNLEPARIVGMDIDPALIRAARQNIRHYLSDGGGAYPASLVSIRGPVAAPVLPAPTEGEKRDVFPHNVVFLKGNYVLERDELAEVQHPEYDAILCLSVTKWVHLNWGDAGLKRMFRRMFRHLKPGGVLVLEPQPWSSYGKRKKLTEEIFRNYSQITLKPEQFTSYLVSSEVGFSSYELLAAPCAASKGFQRPIYAFHKAAARSEPPPPPARSATAAAPVHG